MEIKTVLIIDDNDYIRRIMKLALGREFHVLTAESGSKGITIAEAENPDLVLLDVRMPEMNGAETLAKLRSIPKTANIPVIFVSASVQTTEIAEYRKLDVLGIIEKPFDPMTLVLEIRSMTADL
jgi:CheY-like chemotaxis protein